MSNDSDDSQVSASALGAAPDAGVLTREEWERLDREYGITVVLKGEAPDLTISLMREAEGQLTKRWRQRIVDRIDASMERDLRAGGPPQMPSTEQAALAMLKGLASHLEESAQHLLKAAAALKDAGKGNHANAAYIAGKRAQHTAQELTGG